MRTQDDKKKEALFEATIKLVNDIGFAASSVSKIAKEAGVSPSTIYVYYKNKEELLVSTYVELKKNISKAILNDFDDTKPIRDALKGVWFSLYEFITTNRDHYQFCEQFANSPYVDGVNKEELDQYFIPIVLLVERGIREKIIKDVNLKLITAFLLGPVSKIVNPREKEAPDLTKETLEIAFTMAWDAIKL